MPSVKKVLLCVSVVLLIATRVAALDIDCLKFQDYISSCSAVEIGDDCSKQFYDLCCRCEETWGVDFPFCSFNESLFPTPTPTVTPTPEATATPLVQPTATATVPPDSTPSPTSTPSPSDTPSDTAQPTPTSMPVPVCSLAFVQDKSLCTDGQESFFFDGTGSLSKFGGALSYSWSVSCVPDAQDLNPVVVVPNSTPPATPVTGPEAVLLVGEPAVGREVQCDVALTVTEIINGQPVSVGCALPVLVNNCALGCTTTSVMPVLFAMDGSGRAELHLMETMATRLPKNVRRSNSVRKILAVAKETYVRAWTATWSFPTITKLCTDTTICTKVSMAELHTKYEVEIKLLRSLSLDIVGKLKKYARTARARKQAERQRKLVEKLYEQSAAALASAPTERSVCG